MNLVGIYCNASKPASPLHGDLWSIYLQDIPQTPQNLYCNPKQNCILLSPLKSTSITLFRITWLNSQKRHFCSLSLDSHSPLKKISSYLVINWQKAQKFTNQCRGCYWISQPCYFDLKILVLFSLFWNLSVIISTQFFLFLRGELSLIYLYHFLKLCAKKHLDMVSEAAST